jgi:peptide-methionine (S)-S-oxide reductase
LKRPCSAAGAFWCLEAVFDELDGVQSVESGYAGGRNPNPSYDDVCGGRTGHAEVVRVTFDPSVLSFRDLLTVFFTIHDPTTKDRQGNDVGTQYRSVIFCETPAQRATAEAVRAELTAARLWKDSIVTEIADAAPFYEAERHHPGILCAESRPALLQGGGRAQGREIPQALHRTAETQGLAPGAAREDATGSEAGADRPEHRNDPDRGANRAEDERLPRPTLNSRAPSGSRPPRRCARQAHACATAPSPPAARHPGRARA